MSQVKCQVNFPNYPSIRSELQVSITITITYLYYVTCAYGQMPIRCTGCRDAGLETRRVKSAGYGI